MKKLFTLSISLLLFSCTQSPEKKAEENIKAYITSKMDDPKSYEPDSFGKLEPYKEALEDNPEFSKMYTEYKDQSEFELKMYSSLLRSDSTRHPDTYMTTKEYYTKAKDSSEVLFSKVNKFRDKYKGVDVFSIKHRFRGKNKMGALVLDSCIAVLNKDYTVRYIKN